MNFMGVSIIIPAFINKYRTCDRLLLTLQGYINQTLVDDYEIIVVIDGSKYYDEELIYRYIDCEKIVIKIIEERQGMCNAINYGVDFAKYDYILIGVDDAIPLPDCVEKLLSGNLEKNVVMGEERWLLHTTGIKNLFTGELYLGINLDDYKKQYGEGMRKFSKISIRDIDKNIKELIKHTELVGLYKDLPTLIDKYPKHSWLYFRPGIVLIEKEKFLSINGFDRHFDPDGWYSDVDFGIKLKNNNIGIELVSDAKFIHPHHLKFEDTNNLEKKRFKTLIDKYPYFDILFLQFLWDDLNYVKFIETLERLKELHKNEDGIKWI